MLGGAIWVGSSNIKAQTFGVEYTTEWQTDFKCGYDWLNLLKISANLPLNEAVSIEASTISCAKTGDDVLVEDLLTYSNIEAGNIPLTFSRLGLALAIRNTEVFVGINNVNEDYFTSDMTAFFTNSSCGITPTISCNYDIANYPLASWCLHYRQMLGDVSFQTSLYPGQGYSRIFGHDNLFSLDIKRDGIFSISSIDYRRNGIYCVLGIALHDGVCMADVEREQGQEETPPVKKRLSAATWLLSEFKLPCNLGLLAHGSFSTVSDGCKSYLGIGAIYGGGKVEPGISFNHATFSKIKECDLELTARIHFLNDMVCIQPSVHLIGSGYNHLQSIAMMRLYISI